jgi:methylmalonyl-CoA mutase N-terminal domain/subunit
MENKKTSRERWLDGLKKEPPQRRTSSGLPVPPLATPEDSGAQYHEALGNPGEFPFTRGPYNTMYLSRPWTMRQYSGFGTPEETNQRYKYLLEQGGTGLSVAFDLPSQIGLDSDHEMAMDEVGRVGVAIDSLEDMETVFDGIDLGKVSTSFTINATAAVMLCMYVAVGEKQGVPIKDLSGTIQNDMLKEFAARGAWIFPPKPSMRLIADSIVYCAENLPRFNPISIAGAHYRDAGATAMQEIAFTLADAVEYVEEVLARGMKIDEFAPRLSFFFYTYTDIFEEAAKYRAARRMWARLVKERWGAENPKSMAFRFGVACGGASLCAPEPMNNIVRVAYQVLAAALGGAQSIFSCAYDEAYALPTEDSTRLALRTQQVCAEEAGLINTVDPLGGSFYLESLTDSMEKQALKIMDQIHELGGMVDCIEKGIVQKWIADEAYRTELAIQKGDKAWIGVNKHQCDEPPPRMEVHRHNLERAEEKIGKLRELRHRRDRDRVDKALSRLKQACGDHKQNLMPHVLEAVKSYATVGEITAAMKEVFGEFKEPAFI